jgi:hypothetical protein
MNALLQPAFEGACALCGIPLDAQYFDESSIVDVTSAPPARRSDTTSLVQFELPPQYCGVLQYFFQFTDLHAREPERIDTPDFEWTIRVNGHPLHPYLGIRHIVNPWGCPCCPIAIRLDEGARLEFAVRRVGESDDEITRIGARLVGRYWYNTSYGTRA